MAERGVHAAIIMDLVGHDIQVPGDILPKPWLQRFPGLKGKEVKVPYLSRLLAVTGAESHPVRQLVEQTRLPDKLLLLMTPNRNVGDMSDHGVFRQNGVPYLFLSCGHWLHYHEVTDTPDRLNYDKMTAITRYVVGLVQALAGTRLPRTDVRESDTVRQEIAWSAEHLRRDAAARVASGGSAEGGNAAGSGYPGEAVGESGAVGPGEGWHRAAPFFTCQRRVYGTKYVIFLP